LSLLIILRTVPCAAINDNFIVVFNWKKADIYSLTKPNFKDPIASVPLPDGANAVIDEARLYVVTRGNVRVYSLKNGMLYIYTADIE
jgi:hypothetical protein